MDDPARFRPEKEWLEKAANDLKAVEIILAVPDGPLDVAAFHCQQAAEKFLKALLAFQGRDPEKTHDLAYLVEAVASDHPSLRSFLPQAQLLNQYAIMPRYPGPRQFLREDISQALVAAQAIRDAVLILIKRQ